MRLMEALLCRDYISSAFARQQLKIASDAIKALEEENLIQIETKRFSSDVRTKKLTCFGRTFFLAGITTRSD